MDTNTITAEEKVGVETGRAPVPNAQRRPARSEEPSGPAHVLILAGGDGLRSRPVTRALAGDERPKQFCALVSKEPLLVEAQHRASMIVPPSRTILVLTRPHEPYYRDLVAGIPSSQLVVQPENRGTAPAVLYGLLRVAARAPNAPVAILPSDHWVSDDAVFMAHAAAAIGIVRAHPGAVILLGIPPTRPEREYGWIEPAEPVADVWSDLHGVRRFVEKPDADLARRLEASGRSLWSTSVVVGRVEALLFLFALARPDLVDAFLGIWPALGSPAEARAVERLYADLPAGDFSRDILADRPEALTVLAVSGVAWEDVGHPSRILAARRHVSQSRQRAREASAAGPHSRTA